MQNLRKNRGKLDIFAEIIEFTEQPRKKTRIMYKANLSGSQLKSYLLKLIGFGLLVEVAGNPGTEYENTEKGRKFLRSYKNLKECME